MSDDKKRSQYDTFGTAGNDAAGGFNAGANPFSRGFSYQSQMDPEELFRTIFGDAFKSGRNYESMWDQDGPDSGPEISQVNN